MTRNEFLTALRGRLSALPKKEQDAALKYYEEYFDEAESEEDAARQLGSPDSIAEKILADYAPPPAAMPAPSPAPEAPAKPRHSAWYYVGIVTLCVLASPMLIGLGAAALGMVLAMLAVLLAVLICIVAPFFALSAALLASGGYVLALAFGAAPVFLPGGVTLFGTGLLLLSLGLLCSVFTGYLCYWIGLLFKKIFSSGKRKKAVKGAAV